VNTLLPTADCTLHDLERQGFELNPNPTTTWHSTLGTHARTMGVIDMQPTNPQVDIKPTGKCKLWIRKVELMLRPQLLECNGPTNEEAPGA